MLTALVRLSAGNVLVIVDSVAGMTSAAPTPSTARSAISSPAEAAVIATAEPAPNTISPTISANLRPNRSPSAPAGRSRDAKASEYASITQTSSVCEAWVSRAMSGSATFSDAIAATTAARARQTTAVITPWRGERDDCRFRVHVISSCDDISFISVMKIKARRREIAGATRNRLAQAEPGTAHAALGSGAAPGRRHHLGGAASEAYPRRRRLSPGGRTGSAGWSVATSATSSIVGQRSDRLDPPDVAEHDQPQHLGADQRGAQHPLLALDPLRHRREQAGGQERPQLLARAGLVRCGEDGRLEHFADRRAAPRSR